ncbi:putative MFS-type transporter YfnC [Paenibacillus sp. J31TS4]|uniref:MFS transporter n=1 Tax=Paenibacillus sp. J31TS4 TaxID=2807195 RepID=UPI001B22800A|nr:MFS transporter [Paenibacillus sp. J31TS4]GIP39007.1 putative MFS-type transporter YfnC [Paenibacillus sp. J31TS4]
MSSTAAPVTAGQLKPNPAGKTMYRILFLIGLVHLFNDSIQSVFQSISLLLQEEMHLSFTQIGFITFVLNFTASIMQPMVGIYTDRKPSPYLLPLGMAFTFTGMLVLAFASSYGMVLLSVFFVGIGSAVFHPEGSRVSYMAAGPRRGLAQSIFQVGGNAGQALAPLMAIFIFYKLGLFGSIWFTLVAAAAILVQLYIAGWYRQSLALRVKKQGSGMRKVMSAERRKQIRSAILLLVVLVFVRSWYHASISNYFAYYAMDKFGITKDISQYFIFLFLAAGAAGTFVGGPLADRFGRRNVLFLSIAGTAPFALVLPYAGQTLAYALLTIIGFILLSSFSVSVVYAQELVPGKVGTVSGLITGLAFGMGALGAVGIGKLIDLTSIGLIMRLCGFLPLLGLLTLKLPSDRTLIAWQSEDRES